MKKKEIGITLIALAVIIIVLLILAGVTMSMIIGERGLIARAQNAEFETELANVREAVILKVNEYSLVKVYDNLSDSILNMLYNNGYIDYNSVVNVEKLGIHSNRYGKGNINTGDYYTISNEKLIYVNSEKDERVLQELHGIGILDLQIYFKSNVDNNKILLDANREGILNIELQNYDSDKITLRDVKYEISISNKENCPFNIKNNDINLAESVYSGHLKGNSKQNQSIEFNIGVKENAQIQSSEKLEIIISVLEPVTIERKIEIEINTDTITDYSGNGYDAKLMNGTSIVKDENGRYAMNFDGIDDFVQIPVLSQNFDWNSGINIEAEIVFDEIQENSTILMLGNGLENDTGKDHIILRSDGNVGKAYFEIKANSRNYYTRTTNEVISKGEKATIKITMDKNILEYKSEVYINGNSVSSSDNYVSPVLQPIQNVDRKENYLGKSYWSEDSNFKGKIYSIKVTTNSGETIIDYNLNR